MQSALVVTHLNETTMTVKSWTALLQNELCFFQWSSPQWRHNQCLYTSPNLSLNFDVVLLFTKTLSGFGHMVICNRVFGSQWVGKFGIQNQTFFCTQSVSRGQRGRGEPESFYAYKEPYHRPFSEAAFLHIFNSLFTP